MYFPSMDDWKNYCKVVVVVVVVAVIVIKTPFHFYNTVLNYIENITYVYIFQRSDE